MDNNYFWIAVQPYHSGKNKSTSSFNPMLAEGRDSEHGFPFEHAKRRKRVEEGRTSSVFPLVLVQ